MPRTAYATAALLTLSAILFVVAQISLRPHRLEGDEPYVLMTTISLLNGHFNVYPAYVARDFVALGLDELSWQVDPTDGYIPPEHGFTFPAIIAPVYAITGINGTRTFTLVISALALPLLFFSCRRAGLSPIGSAMACLALVCTAPWEFYAARMLPEALAGTLTLAIVAAYTRFREAKRPGYAFAVGAMTVLLPIIYLKYSAIAVASGVLLVGDRKLRWNLATYAMAPFALAYVALWIYVYGYSIAVGTGAGPKDFNFATAVSRFWYAFIDREHGIWVWAPGTILAIAGLIVWDRRTAAVQAYLVAVFLLYAALYAAAMVTPGGPEPGRFLVAAAPAMIVLAAMALVRDGRFYLARTGVFAVFVLASGVILGTSACAHHSSLPSDRYAARFPKLYYPD